VRGYAALQGLRFDASPWQGFWHLVDSDLLETRLAESILYLHSQPPLFNLALGLYAKAFGAAFELARQITFPALGALHAFLVVRLAGRAVRTQREPALSTAGRSLLAAARRLRAPRRRHAHPSALARARQSLLSHVNVPVRGD
jgi:hypothetical protein